jgi:small conductance mechanosensitive channel
MIFVVLIINTLRGEQMLKRRIRLIFLSGFLFTLVLWATPAQAQKPLEGEPAAVQKVESAPAPDGDPTAAVTTKQPDIPVEELQLLVRPLSLKELKNEAAAWQLLLKNKVQEISNAEIAIKRQNRSITKQQDASTSLGEAKKALEDAEELQKTATQGSPEYEQATKKVEEAKGKLKKAQEGIKEATQAKKDIKQDESLKKALKHAEKTGEQDQAKEALDELKKSQEKMVAGSDDYTAVGKQSEELEKAIKAFEEVEKKLKTLDPKSPEYQQANQKVEEAKQNLKKAREVVKPTTTTNTGAGAAEKSSKKLDETAATLENTTIKTEAETKTSGEQPADEATRLNQKGKHLEKTAEKLDENAKVESKLKNQLVASVTELQSNRTAVVDRFNVVLEELDRKGGDIKSYRQYIEAISRVEVDVKDTQGVGVRLISWVKSEEGGLRWVNNFGKFVGIVAVSVIVSQILGIIINQLLKLSKTSKLLRQFLVILVKRGGVVVGVLIALTALEVSLAPVLALLGGAGFILAFALQSNLGNFASGLMIMVNKPFDVGDEVKIGSLWGWVDSITLASTRIKGFGGQIFTVPNNTVWSDTIENLTTGETRKVAFSLRIGFDQDLTEIEKVLVDIFQSHPKILKDPAPSTFVFNIEDYYISLIASGWAKTDEFWPVSADIIRTIQTRFEQEGINLAAIPAHDIRIIPESETGDNSSLIDQELVSKQLAQAETAIPAIKQVTN